tara:strand:+ start:17330 stop:17905 length:576 start_codon:yes stop_codon:yes gene_type:complete
MRQLYEWTIKQSNKKSALWILSAVAFVESSVFPIPPDVLLIPIILASRNKAWMVAAICSVSSVAGGFVGYLLGYYLFGVFGQPLVDFYGYQDKLLLFEEYYNDWGGWIVAAGGVTPLPYKLVTIASGALHLDPWIFFIASMAGRGLRFFLVAALLWYFGPSIKKLLGQNFGLFLTLVLVTVVATFFILGLL